jgi:hypothetical protein
LGTTVSLRGSAPRSSTSLGRHHARLHQRRVLRRCRRERSRHRRGLGVGVGRPLPGCCPAGALLAAESWRCSSSCSPSRRRGLSVAAYLYGTNLRRTITRRAGSRGAAFDDAARGRSGPSSPARTCATSRWPSTLRSRNAGRGAAAVAMLLRSGTDRVRPASAARRVSTRCG